MLAGAGATAAAALAGCSAAIPGFGGGADGQFTLQTLEVAGGGTIPHRPAGEPALIDFFASWCPPCRPQMTELRAVDDQLPELHMVSISWEDNADAIRQFWREFDGTWPVAQDTELEVAEAYGVTGLPTKVLLDADGESSWEHTGLAEAEAIAEEVSAVL